MVWTRHICFFQTLIDPENNRLESRANGGNTTEQSRAFAESPRRQENTPPSTSTAADDVLLEEPMEDLSLNRYSVLLRGLRDRFNEINRLRGHATESSSSTAASSLDLRDPEMPVLEPQVDLNNLSSASTSSAFRRLRDLEPSRARGGMCSYRSTRDDSSEDDGGRRSPCPPVLSDSVLVHIFRFFFVYNGSLLLKCRQYFQDILGLSSSTQTDRPVRSPDFPILALRERIDERNKRRADTSSTPAHPPRPVCE